MKSILIVILALLGPSLMADEWNEAQDGVSRAQIAHTVANPAYQEYSLDALVMSAICYGTNFARMLKLGCQDPSTGPVVCWEQLSAEDQLQLRKRALRPCIPTPPKKRV